MIARIKDNQHPLKGKQLEQVNSLSGLRDKIADKTLAWLEKHEDIFVFPDIAGGDASFDKSQMILTSQNDSYETGNLMGFLGYNDERLIIESRFGSEHDSNGRDHKDYFLQYLLEKVVGPSNLVTLETDASTDDRIFDFLLLLFPAHLKQALRKGPFKNYVHRACNDLSVKGTIDVSRHIKQNTLFTGRIAFNQREFSYDNDLMELVRHTIEYIKRRPEGRSLLSGVRDEVRQVVQVTPGFRRQDRRKVIDANKKNVVRHAYFHEYRALQRICLLILQNRKLSMGAGSNRMYGVLFDGAWLWEEYVASLIGGVFDHPDNKKRHGDQALFSVLDEEDRVVGSEGVVFPDFIRRDQGSVSVVADAKYKRADNIKGDDYLQIIAYLYRFGARWGYFLYPENQGKSDAHLLLNEGTSYDRSVAPRDDVHVVKHGFSVPAEAAAYATYEAFSAAMKASEAAFKRTLLGTL